jgi:competence protein ComEA
MAEQSRGTVLAWVVAAVLATVAVLRLAGGEPERAPRVKLDGAMAGAGASVRAGPAGPSGSAAGQPGSASAGEGVFVHVAGAVRRPGLFRVPAGSRVAAALARAGGPGPKADLTLVNLAAPLQDGQQVVVPAAGAAPPSAAAEGAGAGLTGAKPSLATATVEQLEELDGIGPTLAERIVEYRDAHGGFRSLGELRDVEGIGEKRFESLREGLQP